MPKWLKVILCLLFWPVGLPVLFWDYARMASGRKAVGVGMWAFFLLSIAAMGAHHPDHKVVPASSPAPASHEAVAAKPAMARAVSAPLVHDAPAVVSSTTEREKVAAYATAVRPIVGCYVSAGQAIAKCGEELANDPSLISDDDWKLRVVVQLAVLSSLDDQLKGVTDVPQSARKAHEQLRLSFEHAHRFATLFATGVDSLDMAVIAKADKEMHASTAHMVQASQKVKSLVPKGE